MGRAEDAGWQEANDLTNIYVVDCQKVADGDGIGRWTDVIYRCEQLRHSPPVIPFAPIALARAGFIDEGAASFY